MLSNYFTYLLNSIKVLQIPLKLPVCSFLISFSLPVLPEGLILITDMLALLLLLHMRISDAHG